LGAIEKSKETKLSADKIEQPITLQEMIIKKCVCPPPEIIQEIGCVEGDFKTDGIVNIKNAKEIYIDDKQYNISQIKTAVSPTDTIKK